MFYWMIYLMFMYCDTVSYLLSCDFWILFFFFFFFLLLTFFFFFFFQAEDGIRDGTVTGVQTCALPISHGTLAAIVIILALLLFGIAHVTTAYGIMAMDQTKPGYQSVLSQIVGAVWGDRKSVV